MTIRKYAIVTAMAALWAATASAQTAAPQEAATASAQTPPPQEEVLGGTAEAVQTPSGPEWWTFSRAPTKHYLIDVRSVARTGDELTVMVARVPTDTAAGDYTHTIDQFGIRCRARQSHVVTSSEAFEDGVPEEPFATDEPWESIARDSFDDAVREITCDNMRPPPPSYPSVKAYFDAGRP